MIIMSDGLRALAGDAMRQALMRFTRSPLVGAMTGAVTTAILQSSSATIIAAVGFVGAGLMEFSHALGIIFGANIGTTITGWMVALIGFKLKLGLLAMPLIFIGVLLHLFMRGRSAHIGYALAGFGLIFVSITIMQQSMSGMENLITSLTLPADTLAGRLLLVGIGVVITSLTQSSSVGVAATLTLLYAGLVNFEQAASMVIGMDVGTTIKAMLATIGGSVGAKRTGYSHVIYNLFTAVFALLLITPFVSLWEYTLAGSIEDNAEIALVAFHTTFNVLGVIAVLPVTRQFALIMERLIPDPHAGVGVELDKSLLAEPSIALTAVQNNLYTQILNLFTHLKSILDKSGTSVPVDMQLLQGNLEKIHAYIDHIHLTSEAGREWHRLVAMIHTLDHMQRLHERCAEDAYRARVVREAAELTEEGVRMLSGVNQILDAINGQQWQQAIHEADQLALEMHKGVEPLREQLMQQAAYGRIDIPHVTARLEAVRWLERVSKHVARICHHYSQVIEAAGK